jgi:hypothetical protein
LEAEFFVTGDRTVQAIHEPVFRLPAGEKTAPVGGLFLVQAVEKSEIKGLYSDELSFAVQREPRANVSRLTPLSRFVVLGFLPGVR